MARLNIHRFCRPELLKQIEPVLLRWFLSKVAPAYAASSTAIQGEQIDYNKLAEFLGTPSRQYPPGLVEALYYAHDFSKDRAAQEELRRQAQAFLEEHPPGDEPIDVVPMSSVGVVMLLWPSDDGCELVQRVHAEYCFVHPRSFESFYPADEPPNGAPQLDEAARMCAQDYLNRYYHLMRTSSSLAKAVSLAGPAWATEAVPNAGVRVIVTTHEGDSWFLVRKPAPWERRNYIADDGSDDVKQGFPEDYCVVIFCQERCELSVHGESKGEIQALREAFGLALFGNARAFSATGQVTLEPLRTQAREILRCDDISGIARIDLVELEFRYKSPRLGSVIRRAPNLLEIFDANHRMPRAEIRKAVFNVQLEQSERVHPVRIYAGSRTAYARENADRLIKLWMDRRNLLNRQVRLEQHQVVTLWSTIMRLCEAEWSMEGWRQATGTLWETFKGYLKPTRNAARYAVCGRGESGCARIIVPGFTGERLLYRCEQDPARCDGLDLSWEEAQGYVLDMERLANQLARSVEADETEHPPPAPDSRLWHLATRSLGGVDVQIWFTPQAEDEPLGRALQVLEIHGAGGSAPALLLCPGCASVSSRTLELGQKRKVSVLGLDEVATWGPEGPEVDLWPFILEHRERLGALDPTEFCGDRYDLILDPSRGRYWLYGHLLRFGARETTAPSLLLLLAQKTNCQISFKDASRERPDAFPKTSDQSWRNHKQQLLRAFKKALTATRTEASSILSSDGHGYTLHIEPSRILHFS